MEDIFNGSKKLGFGLMRLPLLNQNEASSIDIELTKKIRNLSPWLTRIIIEMTKEIDDKTLAAREELAGHYKKRFYIF